MKRYAIIRKNLSTGQFEYQLWRCVDGSPDVMAADWQYGPFDYQDCVKQVHDRFGSDYECRRSEDDLSWPRMI